MLGEEGGDVEKANVEWLYYLIDTSVRAIIAFCELNWAVIVTF